MADEVLIARGLEALEGLIGLVLEEALEQALARPPNDGDGHVRHLVELRQASATAVVLAEAAVAILRRWPDGRS
jgi:hypothetical protein